MSLWHAFRTHEGAVAHKWKHYFPAYEQHFDRFINRPCVFLEIGVSGGGSLELWRDYLGPHAQIVGVDIDPTCTRWESDGIAVRIGDQSDTSFLQAVMDEFGPPDVVLDDGGHQMSAIRNSFDYLYPRMSPNGVYFIEDLHTAYWEEFGGGLGRPDTFIEFSKSLIDSLNAEWTRGALEPDQFTRSTLSMHFYDSCIVFERGRHLPKSAPRIGGQEPETT